MTKPTTRTEDYARPFNATEYEWQVGFTGYDADHDHADAYDENDPRDARTSDQTMVGWFGLLFGDEGVYDQIGPYATQAEAQRVCDELNKDMADAEGGDTEDSE